jgi:hypothetical protein
MNGMGRHNALLNGHRGEDGATAFPVVAPPVLQVRQLGPMSPWPPLNGATPLEAAAVPAGAAAEPGSAWHRQRRVITAALPVAAVAVVAGIVSYSHIVALSLRAGQSVMDAHLSPIPVDGLIVGGSVILWFGSWLGWFAVAPGVAATLFANVESGLPRGPLAAAVAAWPAVAFTVATIVLERWLKSQARTPALSPASDSGSDGEAGDGPRDERQDEDDPGDKDSPPKPPRQRQESPDAGDKVRAVLKRSPRLRQRLASDKTEVRKGAKEEAAQKAGVSVRTVERVISDMEGTAK